MAVDKRRRKKVRIQAESSSENESSSDESIHDSPSELSDFSDEDGAATSREDVSAQVEQEEVIEPARERLRKAPHNSSEEFKQVFLKMVTEQFGEELAALREANDFGPASISQLVAGLKQGVDIFSENQQRIL